MLNFFYSEIYQGLPKLSCSKHFKCFGSKCTVASSSDKMELGSKFFRLPLDLTDVMTLIREETDTESFAIGVTISGVAAVPVHLFNAMK